ncbi:helix-turn-helix domain-containing protein [Streptomyces sp. NPDC006516]
MRNIPTRTKDVSWEEWARVSKLRAKLGEPAPIRTARGVGYAL